MTNATTTKIPEDVRARFLMLVFNQFGFSYESFGFAEKQIALFEDGVRDARLHDVSIFLIDECRFSRDATKAAEAAPQSCYPDDIEMLRAMIADERERIDMLGDKPLTASRAYSMAVSQRRIDALTTAIEALGGAL